MIETVIGQRRRDLGGFEVGRVLPHPGHRMVGPFVFFDHMGPADLPAGIGRERDVRPHPHIGLATVTYLFSGEIVHRDSVGSALPIEPGAVNWMTAGRGITHSERFERARRQGDLVHGIQAWVALPRELEETEPAFAHYAADVLPVREEHGARVRLIAGTLDGVRAPVQTLSPLFYQHAELAAGARVSLGTEYAERGVYVAVGTIELGGQLIAAGNLAVLTPGRAAQVIALTPAVVMLLGGEPVGERFIEWNFVASSRERIEAAKADWRAGRFKLPDLDHDEFIPLPD